MTAELCAVCAKRPTPDGYACSGCTSRAAGHLAAIVELAPDARLVAAGLVRRGGGGGGGKPASRPPLNDGATDVVDAVQNTLTTLARDIAETRGLQVAFTRPESRAVPDPLVRAAEAISASLEWLRHAVDDQGGAYAVEAFAEIDRCAGRLRGLVNGPSEQKYLGPCGATRQVEVTGLNDTAPVYIDGEDCDGDIYAPRGGSTGRCRTCGAEVASVDREAWLDGEVRAHAFRAAQIAEAYGVNVNTIRSWAARGQLLEHGRDRDERPLFNVGEVLDLAAADAARRAGEQSKRARRAAARAAETEDAA